MNTPFSYELLDSLTTSLNDGLIFLSDDMKIFFCNKKAEEFSVFDNSNEKYFEDAFPELNSEIFKDNHFPAITRPFRIKLASPRFRRHGYFNCSAFCFSEFICIHLRDISTEIASEEATKFVQSFLENSNTLAFACSPEGNIIFANSTVYEKLEYGDFELLNVNITELASETSCEIVKNQLQLAVNKLPLTQEISLVSKNGKIVELILSSNLLEEFNANTVIFSGNDVTLLRKIERKFRKAAHMESIITLAGGIAHDFNNLLTIIQGNAQLIEYNCDCDEEINTRIHSISSAAKKASELTHSLLSFSKIKESGKIPVSIKQSLKEVYEYTKHSFTENYVTTLNIPPTLPIIENTPEILRQLFICICLNAKNSMPDGGHITITASEESLDPVRAKKIDLYAKQCVIISFTDTRKGLTIPREEKIITSADIMSGLDERGGVELAIAFSLVRNLAGSLSYQITPDFMSVYTLYIPVETVVKDEDMQPAKIPEKNKNIKSILVVDDQEMILDLVKDALSMLDYEVYLAESAKEAITVFKAHKEKIGILVIDYLLPDKNGLELIDDLYNISPNIRAILMSGMDEMPATNPNCKVIAGKIKKPFKIANLIEIIDNISEKN